MQTLLIYKESTYVYIKWSELKKALVVLYEAIFILAEVYTSAITIMST